MKISTGAIVCFRNFAGLAHAFAGVVQCVFAILFKGSHVDGFEFGLNVMLGVMNIPLGCVLTTVMRKRFEAGEPGQYVALNRVSVSLLWHSVVFNAACASIVYLLPSDPAPLPGTTSTRFHERWLVALDYSEVQNGPFGFRLERVAVSAWPWRPWRFRWLLVFLATACLFSLSKSPLKSVIPKGDIILDDYTQFARVDNVELRPFTWVFDGSPASQLAQRRGPGRPRTPLSSRGTDLPFLPPRFTFCRGHSVGGIATCEHLAVAGTSRRRDGRNPSTGGGVAPLQTRASSREGCCCSLSSGDEDFETADSFFTDCFDEVPRNSVQAAAGLPDVGNKERSSSAPGVDARPSQGRDRPKPALQRLASMDLGVDSLGNLTNLELLARQWRTSVMLRHALRAFRRAFGCVRVLEVHYTQKRGRR
ncbi:hypothetical protein HPB47_025785 [Ixodes persulcatus]|uniref:Uncharacterized protein n=1 Tax=Ixodes persulcatus TaxID=34615 RepID=A0AC60Q0V4_IXOPE|nr:hypothetical protein HPB47_025785 [Ixodes persulcatus]